MRPFASKIFFSPSSRRRLATIDMDTDLRNALQKVTNNGKPENHVADIESLKEHFPHSIMAVREFDSRSGEAFNCFMFGLGIHKEKWALDAMSRREFPAGFPSKVFMSCAINERNIEFIPQGVIVLYSDDIGTPQHMGRGQEDGSVISKWGSGHLWQHELFEVPTSYGNMIRYLSSEQADKIIDYLHTLYFAVLGDTVV